ncbi:CBO0543 family protein [Paenibacillus prosopidis]|uniref:Uncharacterized protein n=1 Tax=Paenibacillus prosopidis TaxID=630520 RepID=A0A368VP17_9BACL|nr:CBO0543 family protein [Paenibacillus prosopidis]RCW43469.1 hypothetical protein DFP97_113142 [Paenibacillus prosopidis]
MAYASCSLVFFILTLCFVPKQCKLIPLYGTLMTAILAEFAVDAFLDFKYDLYGYFEKGVEYSGFLVSLGIFPLFNAIFLNLFPFGQSIVRKTVYIFYAIVFCVLYEQGALHFGFLYYNGWKWWYSLLTYPLSLSFVAWNYIRLQKRVEYEHGT